MLEDRPAVAELCDGTLTLTLTLRQAQEGRVQASPRLKPSAELTLTAAGFLAPQTHLVHGV